MRNFGSQNIDKSLEKYSVKREKIGEQIEKHEEIREVLKRFQHGYTERNIEKVEEYMEELFVSGDDTYVLGTSTGELCLGSEGVKQLIKGDWEYWGDVNVDWENALISIEGDVAWFTTSGTVKYSFQHTPERYEGYLNFIKEKAQDKEMSLKQRLTFINWVLTLTYFQREDRKRDYLWPLHLSGVLLKEGDNWKIAQLHFSLTKANFPDERFESSKEFREAFNQQNSSFEQYKNNQNGEDVKNLLKSLETELVGKNNHSIEVINKYFAVDKTPNILGPENMLFNGSEEIKEFFDMSGNSNLSLDLEHSIVTKAGEITWVTAIGLLKQKLKGEELIESTLNEVEEICSGKNTSEEKLFLTHRSISYLLKEMASGEDYTCPIRLSAVISKGSEGLVFESIHFSFAHYWIFEGKYDSM